MSHSEQIMNWYRQLKTVSEDDVLDFDVMLLDRKNPNDAIMAIGGMLMNILENGWNKDVVRMLLDASSIKNPSAVRVRALSSVMMILNMYDVYFRQYPELQEMYLDILVDQQKSAFTLLCSMAKMSKMMITIGNHTKLSDTLLYKLTVVGKEANDTFRRIV